MVRLIAVVIVCCMAGAMGVAAAQDKKDELKDMPKEKMMKDMSKGGMDKDEKKKAAKGDMQKDRAAKKVEKKGDDNK